MVILVSMEMNTRSKKIPFGRKLGHLLEEMGVDQKKLARKIIVSDKTISAWKCHNKIPRGDNLNKLSNFLGVTVDYLLDESKGYPPANGDRLPEKTLDFPGKIRLAQPDRVSEGETIPLVGYVSAGETEIAYSDAGYPTGYGEDEIGRPPGIEDPHAYALIVKGDSMKPFLPDGSLVVVDTKLQPRVEDIVICRERVSNKVYIKQLKKYTGGQVVLTSFNEQEHDPMVFKREDLYFIHKCVWFRRA